MKHDHYFVYVWYIVITVVVLLSWKSPNQVKLTDPPEVSESLERTAGERATLWLALSNKVMTLDEVDRACGFEELLNHNPNEHYNQNEKLVSLQNAYLRQIMLQIVHHIGGEK